MKQIILQIRTNDKHSQQRVGHAQLPKGHSEKRRQYLRKFARIKAIKQIMKYAAITAGILFFAWVLVSRFCFIADNFSSIL